MCRRRRRRRRPSHRRLISRCESDRSCRHSHDIILYYYYALSSYTRRYYDIIMYARRPEAITLVHTCPGKYYTFFPPRGCRTPAHFVTCNIVIIYRNNNNSRILLLHVCGHHSYQRIIHTSLYSRYYYCAYDDTVRVGPCDRLPSS